MAWYDREADDTYKLWGGILLTGVIIVGCFMTKLMTPELLHTIIGFTSGWVVSRTTHPNGNGHTKQEPKEPTTPKRKFTP